jgi:hypothetical protein
MRKLIIGITVATTLALSPGAALAQAMVMDVGLEVDTSYMRQRDCPVTLTFHGEIRTSGAGSVTYRIIRSDGSSGPIRSLEFKVSLSFCSTI